MCRITGYSKEIPLAPRIVRALRAISSALLTLLILPRLTCSGRRVPASLRRPRCSASRVPVVSSIDICASLAWVSWKPLIGRLDWTRAPAYSRAVPKQLRAAPIAPQTIP